MSQGRKDDDVAELHRSTGSLNMTCKASSVTSCSYTSNANVTFIQSILEKEIEMIESSARANGKGECNNDSIFKTKDHMKKKCVTISELEIVQGEFFGDDRIITMSEIGSASVKIKTVSTNNEEETHLQQWILKLPSNYPYEKMMNDRTKAILREVEFYNYVLPDLQMFLGIRKLPQKKMIYFNIPYCLYGKYDVEEYKKIKLSAIDKHNYFDGLSNAPSILILEDLRPKHFGKRHFTCELSVEEVKAALTEIAKVHAVSYMMEQIELEKQGKVLMWPCLMKVEDAVKLYEPIIDRGCNVLSEELNRRNEPDLNHLLHQLDEIKESARKFLHAYLQPPVDTRKNPVCLVHMDFWSENLLFRLREEDESKECDEAAGTIECYILDWQMIARGRPTHDVAQLLCTSMSANDRRSHLQVLLRHYYSAFEKVLHVFGQRPQFNFNTILSEYSDSMKLALMFIIGSIDVVLLESSLVDRLIDLMRDCQNGNYDFYS